MVEHGQIINHWVSSIQNSWMIWTAATLLPPGVHYFHTSHSIIKPPTVFPNLIVHAVHGLHSSNRPMPHFFAQNHRFGGALYQTEVLTRQRLLQHRSRSFKRSCGTLSGAEDQGLPCVQVCDVPDLSCTFQGRILHYY